MQKHNILAGCLLVSWTLLLAYGCGSPDQCLTKEDCGKCQQCRNGSCITPEELCDGIDNDCDDQIDEGCPDPCENVKCDNPPPDKCINQDTLRVYESTGSCLQGMCNYTYSNNTCALGCDQEANKCFECDNLCPQEYVTECNNGQIKTCIADQNGCLSWSDPQPCETSFCQDATTCQGCDHACSKVGATKCDRGVVQTCVTDGQGCRIWSEAVACELGYCKDESICANDPCKLDTTCKQQNRVCENLAGKAVCTDCLEGFHPAGDDCLPDANCSIRQLEHSYHLKDIHFFNKYLGWAVGAPHWDDETKEFKATVLITTDGGQSWTAQSAPGLSTLRGVVFVDDLHGWGVGTQGAILHTNNGGESWTQQFVDTQDEFRAVAFVDANLGWATAITPCHYDFMGQPDDWRGSIWHTNDGGANWIRQALPENTSILNRIDFVDGSRGWAVGLEFIGMEGPWPEHRAAVYRTQDAGDTWVLSGPTDLELVLTGVDFVDQQTGWVVGFKMNSSVNHGTVIHTQDGGQNWEIHTPADTLWDVHFLDAERGWAVGASYGSAWGAPVWRTQDGGEIWEKIRMEHHEGEGLYAVAPFADKVIAVGDHDYQATSLDPWGSLEPYDGAHLFAQKYISTHLRLEDVFFLDENTGWAVGKRSYEPEMWGQIMLYTDNAGADWITQYESPPDMQGLFSFTHRLDSIVFVDALHGWAVGGSENKQGSILHTSNGGTSWQEQGQELYDQWDLEFFAVGAIDTDEAWVLAESHFPDENIYLAHTQDAGEHWEWVDSGVEGSLGIGFAYVQGELDFTGPQYGWAVGGQSKVLHTQDGGNTWIPQAFPSEYLNIHAVDMIDNQVGWIAGEGLFATQDGGTNWTEKEIELNSILQDVAFVDRDNGWVVGGQGDVFYTQDGNSWNQVDCGVSIELLSIDAVTKNHIWTVGDLGAIIEVQLHTNN